MDINPFESSQVPVKSTPRSPVISRILGVLCGLVGALFAVPSILMVLFIIFALFTGGTLGTPESVQVFFGINCFGFVCGTLGIALILLARDLWNGTQRHARLAMVLLAPFLLAIGFIVVRALVFQ